MIQDIAPHLYDNAYKPEAPDKDSIALYYEDHVCLMARTTEAIRYPRFEELEATMKRFMKNGRIYLRSTNSGIIWWRN